jgi:hypothetical protein
MLEGRGWSRRVQGFGLAAGFVGAGLLWVGGQVLIPAVLTVGVVLLGAFMVAMGRAGRR